MSIQIARRMQNVQRSFVREILKVTARPEIISFAGGLPHPKLIPVAKIGQCMQRVLERDGAAAMQYCTTEGYPPLREWVAGQYRSAGLDVSAEQILIISGSQQAFDLLGKLLLEPGDPIVIEDPTYIAALQAFGMYEPTLIPISMDEQGIDPRQLGERISPAVKLVYCMPNFQNPTGISYSEERRAQVVEALQDSSAILIEDDPYSLLRFDGATPTPMARNRPDRAILLGSFSKFLAPGMRLGWICAPTELMEKLVIAKQAVDLHSENLGQRAIHEFVTGGDFEPHLCEVRSTYSRHCLAMRESIARHLPGVHCTNPQGGMFLWLTLTPGISGMDLFHLAIERGVAFVPGQAFHSSGAGDNTLRLNFSNCDPTRIDEGIRRLAEAINQVPRRLP